MAISILQSESVSAREETAQIGEAIYEKHLKARLEPDFRGQIVAIHLPSQDYFLGLSILEAADRLRQKYPYASFGEVYARAVGERAAIRAHTPRVTDQK
jgi:hypothetical protein